MKFNKKFDKKSIIFSIVTIFIILIIVSVAYIMIGNKTFSINNAYHFARISFVNSDLEFFKGSFMTMILKFSSYNCLRSLIDYYKVHGTPKNYTIFTYDFKDCVINGTLHNGTKLAFMKNKTLKYFTKKFMNESLIDNKIYYNFTIKNITIGENQPYYVNVNLTYHLGVFPLDHLCFWNFNGSDYVSISVYELKEPLYYYNGNPNDIIVRLRSAEFYSSLNNTWTVEKFNETIDRDYVFTHKLMDEDYLIGRSFLERLTNLTYTKFRNVVAFYSFDRDVSYSEFIRDLNKTYVGPDYVFDDKDSSYGNLYGISRAIYSFDNNTYRDGMFIDKTAYRNNIDTINNVVLTNNSCASGMCADFNGVNSYLLKSSFKLNVSRPFSFSIWFYPDKLPENSRAVLLKLGNSFNDGFTLSFDTSGKNVSFKVGDGTHSLAINTSIINVSTLYNIIGIYNGSAVSLYENGVFLINKTITFVPKTNYNNLYIGGFSGDYFKGTIDEISIFQYPLDFNDALSVFKNKKADFVEYKDTDSGKGVFLDGIENYVNISFNYSLINFLNSSFSILVKFIPYVNSSSSFSLVGFKNNLDIGYSSGKFYFEDGNNYPSQGISYPLVPNKEYLAVFVRDKSLNKNLVYINGKLVGSVSSSSWNPSLSNVPLFFGRGKFGYFKGILDEVVLYNTSLSPDRIKDYYLNYNGFVKGKANYIGLINPNQLGYNTTEYGNLNVSYSDIVFYDYKNGMRFKNMTLYNVTGITSNDVSKKYYHFLFDMCMIEAMNVFDWKDDGYKASFYHIGRDVFCRDLAFRGIY